MSKINYLGIDKIFKESLVKIAELNMFGAATLGGFRAIFFLTQHENTINKLDSSIPRFDIGKNDLEFATKIVSNENKLLVTNMLLMEYVYLNSCIQNVIRILIAQNDLALIPEFTKIKISLVDSIVLTREELLDHLADAFNDANGGIEYGCGKFERLLKPFLLSGEIDEEVSNGIYLLSQIRNCVLHKDSVCDKSFKTKNPRIIVNLNDSLPINADIVQYLTYAVLAYLLIIVLRLHKHEAFKQADHSELTRTQNDYMEQMSRLKKSLISAGVFNN